MAWHACCVGGDAMTEAAPAAAAEPAAEEGKSDSMKTVWFEVLDY